MFSLRNNIPYKLKTLNLVAYIAFWVASVSAAHRPRQTYQNVIVNENPVSRKVTGRHGAVAVENKQCSNVGLQILKESGSAVDSAIASALCIGVINSFATGKGYTLFNDRDNDSGAINRNWGHNSGGFMLIRTPGGEYDFTTEDMYVKNGTSSRVTGLAVGVPGEIRGYELAHAKYGKLPWSRLFKDAIRVARDGFVANQLLSERLEESQGWILDEPEWAEVYAPRGKIAREGELIQRPALAKTLETIATYGADAFYKGTIAESLIKTIQKTGGIMTLVDLQDYRALQRPVISTQYHQHKVYTTSAPTSGPILLSVLNLIEPYHFSKSSLSYHRFIESLKFGYAARTEFGDPLFLDNNVLDKFITKEWADSVRPFITDDSTHNVSYYNATYENNDPHGTMHLSVIDKDNGAVSLTSTVNLLFGSKIMDRATGIILNDEQDDFSTPGIPNAFGYEPSPHNFIKPGKRPLSSITPAIIENASGQLEMVVGASGGSHIISATLNAIINTLDFDEDIFDAVGAPRLHHQLVPNRIGAEVGFDARVLKEMEARGHTIKEEGRDGYVSCVQAIYRHDDGLIEAASDPRKFGLAAAY